MKDQNDKKDLVRDRVRRQAQQSAKDLINGLTRRARQDVNERLKQLGRHQSVQDEVIWSPPCGTRLDSAKGLEKGVVTLFSRWSSQAQAAANRGDLAQARDLANRLAALPLTNLPQLRRRLSDLLRKLIEGTSEEA